MNYNPIELDDALNTIVNYIVHGFGKEKLLHASDVLVKNEYEETRLSKSYFRVIQHQIDDSDFEKFNSIGEFINSLKDFHRFEIGGPQSFSSTFEEALAFGHYSLWDSVELDDGEYELQHQENSSLPSFVFVIYEVIAPKDAVLYSTDGLNTFLGAVWESSASKALYRAINDHFEGYPSENEILLNTSDPDFELVCVHMYDDTTFEKWNNGEWSPNDRSKNPSY